MAKILIIDDEAAVCKLLARPIGAAGHEVSWALTLAEGLAQAAEGAFDLIFLDVVLPDGNGLDAIPAFRKTPSAPDIIIITGAGDPDGAELAIRSGAWTYLQKPPLMTDVLLQLNRSLQYRLEKARRCGPAILRREGIIGASPALEACLAQVAQVAGSDMNVLITGETGTGKELFARAIHANSFRAGRHFVVVDCASLPDSLANSMLFGHKKGAFTGAQSDRAGLVQEADGGTLFLDEIGDLSPDHQKEFLRVLQENRFRPIGSNREVTSDFRLVAATNRDLDQMVKAGLFRQDLLYRIQTFNIHLPPLRSRPQDIQDITRHQITLLCEREDVPPKEFSSDFFEVLMAHDWPGNVRELMHTLESVFTTARLDATLFPHHLPTRLRVEFARRSVRSDNETKQAESANVSETDIPTLQAARDAAIASVEKQYLFNLMGQTRGNLKEAIRISGLSQSRLYSLLKRHGIARP